MAAAPYITTYSQTYSEMGFRQSKMWPPNTLCMTIAGANTAKVAILTFEACFPDSVVGFIPDKSKADLHFVLYSLGLMKDQFLAVSQGATQDNLGLGKLLSFPLLVPDVSQQRRIAAVLSAYDELIENNRKRIAQLENLAEEIYREWFVRLRYPGYENVKVVKGVPETWDNTRFGKFCMLKRGYDLPDNRVVSGEYPVMASTSIKSYHNEFKVKPPVISTGRSGSLGTVLMVHSKAWPLNTALYVKDFFGNSPYLVFYTLKNMGLEAFNSGAGVPTLNRNHINGIKIAVPDKDVQRRFDCIVSPIHEQIEQIRKANALLSTAQESLLPRLISGKLSVENLDIRFPPGMSEELNAEPTAANA